MPKSEYNKNLDLSKTKQADIYDKVNGRFSLAKEAKFRTSRIQRLSLMYYLGEQYSYYNSSGSLVNVTTEQLYELRRKQGVYLFKYNKIKPSVRFFVSQENKRLPALYCVPNKNTEHAKQKAKDASEILEYYRMKDNSVRKNLTLSTWKAITGKAYKWVYPVTDKSPGSDTKSDVDWDVITPFEFFPCPGVIEINKMPWLVIARWVDRRSVESHYEVEIPDAQARSVASIDIDPASMLMSTEERGDMVLVMEYFEKPSNKDKAGAHAVIAGNKLVKSGKFPDWDTRTGYRIIDYDYEPNLIEHWAQGMVDPVIDIQRKINLLYSAWITNRATTMGTKLMIEKGTKVTDALLSNGPKIYEYDKNRNVPQWLDPSPAPGDLDTLLGRLEVNFEEVTGIHGLSKGDEPSQRMPFLAIQYVTELDTNKFKPIFDAHEESERRFGETLLLTLKKYGTTITYRAIDGKDSLKEFLAKDLSEMEIKVERGSSVPESKAGQIGILMEMLQYGQIDLNNPHEKLSFLQALDMGWADGMIEDQLSSLELAQHENRMMLEGNKPSFHPMQNHECHVQEHVLLVDSKEYDGMPNSVLAIVDGHIQQHLERLQPPPQPQAAPPMEEDMMPVEPAPMPLPMEPPTVDPMMAEMALAGEGPEAMMMEPVVEPEIDPLVAQMMGELPIV